MALNKKSITDLDLGGKKVLVRVDFNVPLDDQQHITNDKRIQAALPTIQYILDQGGKAILMSHLGRPDGKVQKKMSLKPAAARLGELLGRPVIMAPECIGAEVEVLVGDLKAGEVILLENLRFHPEEEANDAEFSKQLAKLGDVYVNDAFGTAHRAHASTEGVTHHLSECAAGFLMQKEIDYLGRALENPERPFVAILGGAKVSDKIKVIENLLNQVDQVLIGGGMAYTFMKAQGQPIGKSICENDKLDLAKKLLALAREKNVALVLPYDHVIADKFQADAAAKTVGCEGIEDGWLGVDIGPETVNEYRKVIAHAKTVVWNGPMGVFEMDRFAAGTVEIAKALAASGCVSIVGGGDSVAAIKKAGVSGKITHISTGGGAALELLEGKELPGVTALSDK
jgi:phosphoglycerate kinase